MKNQRAIKPSGCLYILGFFSGLLFIIICGSTSLTREAELNTSHIAKNGRHVSPQQVATPLPDAFNLNPAGDMDVAVEIQGTQYQVSVIALGFEERESVLIRFRVGEMFINGFHETVASDVGSINAHIPYPTEAQDRTDVEVVAIGELTELKAALPPLPTTVELDPTSASPEITNTPPPAIVPSPRVCLVCTNTPGPSSPTPPRPMPSPTLIPPHTPTPSPTFVPREAYYPNWRGEYFNTAPVVPNNLTFAGKPALVRDDALIAFDWRSNSPCPGDIAENWYSARWTRHLNLPEGRYNFILSADDMTTVYINGDKLIGYMGKFSRPNRVSRYLQKPGGYDFEVDYVEYWGDANVHFYWERDFGRCCWKVAYYRGAEFFGDPIAYDTIPNQDLHLTWDPDILPEEMVKGEAFSAHITRQYQAPGPAGKYHLCLYVQNSARLWLDHKILLDRCVCGDAACFVCKTTTLSKRPLHELSIEYHYVLGDRLLGLWTVPAKETEPWIGAFFDNGTVSGLPTYVQTAANINFDWGAGGPDPRLPHDQFSIRWIRTRQLMQGRHYIYIEADDGVRLWINDKSMLDAWHEGRQTYEVIYDVLPQKETVEIKLDYFEAQGMATIRLHWDVPPPTCTPTAPPPTPTLPLPTLPPTWPPPQSPTPNCVTATSAPTPACCILP